MYFLTLPVDTVNNLHTIQNQRWVVGTLTPCNTAASIERRASPFRGKEKLLFIF